MRKQVKTVNNLNLIKLTEAEKVLTEKKAPLVSLKSNITVSQIDPHNKA